MASPAGYRTADRLGPPPRKSEFGDALTAERPEGIESIVSIAPAFGCRPNAPLEPLDVFHSDARTLV
jgi:hypothetical protein